MGSVVVVSSCSGRIIGFDARSGASLWTYDASSDAEGTEFHGSGIVVETDVVVPGDTAEGARLYRIDARSGKVIWKTAFDRGIISDLILTPGRDPLVIGIESDGSVVAVRASSGERSWGLGLESRGGRWRPQSPVLVGQNLIVPGIDGTLYALAVDSGKVLWRRDVGVSFTTSVASDGSSIWVGCDDDAIRRFAASDGAQLSEMSTEGTPFGALTLVKDGVVALQTGGRPTAVCLSRDLSTRRWLYEAGAEWSMFRPYLRGGEILVGSEDRIVCAIAESNGTLSGCFAAGGVPRSIAEGERGTLFVGTLAGTISAIRR